VEHGVSDYTQFVWFHLTGPKKGTTDSRENITDYTTDSRENIIQHTTDSRERVRPIAGKSSSIFLKLQTNSEMNYNSNLFNF
jgi:hypothetical protein